jgi:formate hydrogenlyase subunit 5
MSAAPDQAELPAFLPEGLGAAQQPAPDGEIRLRTDLAQLTSACELLTEHGARFITLMTARFGEDSVVAVFAMRGMLISLSAPRPAGELPAIGLGERLPAARWPERVMLERSRGSRPENQEQPLGPRLAEPDADLLDHAVEGLDVFRIPFGPVRSGVFEAIQFVIETGGEDVLRMHTRPFFKHRGLERRFAGLAPDPGVHVAERIAGIATVAYAGAFCSAVERALGIEAPPHAQQWRTVHAELERLACHLDVIAKEAETTALSVAHARFQILKEQVSRVRAMLCGSRFGRGVLVPGGVRRDGAIPLDDLLGALDRLERGFLRDRRLFLSTASMTDRLIGAGRLPRRLIEQYGAVGPLARGSAVSVDARHERPYGHYRRVGLRVITSRDGDAMARINVRLGEIEESLRIMRSTIDDLRRDPGPLSTALPAGGTGTGFGWSEAPQGELLAWVELRDGLLERVHFASPSLRNWALFDHAFPRDVLTDFAFIEHSFGLTPAGADR